MKNTLLIILTLFLVIAFFLAAIYFARHGVGGNTADMNFSGVDTQGINVN